MKTTHECKGMNINRNNYELYFIDYLEGNLSGDEEEMLRRFLEKHADLAAELEGLEGMYLTPEPIEYPEKELLRKTYPTSGELPSKERFDIFAIAYLEGDLHPEQKRDFEQFINDHPSFARELDQYRKTFIRNEPVRYPFKKRLKKQGRFTGWRYRILIPAAAAAAITAMILVMRMDFTTPPNTMAVSEEPRSENPVNTEEDTPEKSSRSGTEMNTNPRAIQVIRQEQKKVPQSAIKSMPSGELKKQVGQDLREQQSARQQPVARLTAITPPPTNVPDLQVTYDRIRPLDLSPVKTRRTVRGVPAVLEQQVSNLVETASEQDKLFWRIAGSSIRGINRIAGTDMDLMASTNEDGEVSGFKFSSRILTIEAPLSREE